MPAFVELTTDPFEEARSSAYSAGMQSRYSRKARRPLRGLEIKEDTPAVLRVIRYDGTEVGLVDAGALSKDGISTAGYSNFLLQSVQEARMEKHQIVETFGAAYIYFFGEAPRFLDVQVVVINSFDFNWEAEWWENYENNFRGTKLVEQGARLYMFYDDNIVEGYMLMSQGVKVADQPLQVQMTFRMFVTGYRNVSLDVYTGGDYPIRASALAPQIETTDPNRPGSATTTRSGESLQAAKAAALPAETARYGGGGGAGGFDTGLRSKDLAATIPGTDGIDTALVGAPGPPVEDLLAMSKQGKQRGKIADNTDEYIGGESVYATGQSTQNALLKPETAQQEVDDLPTAAVTELDDLGADINNPSSLKDLGMIPKSFKELKEDAKSFGEELTSFEDVKKDIESIAKDPLDFVLGGGGTIGHSASMGNAPAGDVYGASAGAYVGSEGAGARAGVTGAGSGAEVSTGSKYGDGPGYGGQVGHGEYGGTQTGSSMGDERDPGFKEPDFSDPVEPEVKQKKPEQYSSFAGDEKVGLDDSHQGKSGGASTVAEQEPAFAMISVETVL
jgi:hypothetical protein